MTLYRAELLILIPTTLTAGYLMFIMTVLQPVMNGLDTRTFQPFVPLLLNKATASRYTVLFSSITFVALIPYFIFYGVQHGWFTAGLIMFVLSSVFGKVLNLPVYSRVKATSPLDTSALNRERRALQTANAVRALTSLAAVVLMVIQLL